MKKIVVAIVITLFLGACSSKQLYTIGDISKITKGRKYSNEFIAVEKIELPSYLMDSSIYKKRNPYNLVEIENAHWIADIDKHLTRVVISYLQKSLNNPNIYPYPWSNIDHIDKKLSITINKFIAYKNIVTLEANYNIVNRKRRTNKNHYFSVKERVEGENIEAILDAMERGYFKLIEDINLKL